MDLMGRSTAWIYGKDLFSLMLFDPSSSNWQWKERSRQTYVRSLWMNTEVQNATKAEMLITTPIIYIREAGEKAHVQNKAGDRRRQDSRHWLLWWCVRWCMHACMHEPMKICLSFLCKLRMNETTSRCIFCCCERYDATDQAMYFFLCALFFWGCEKGAWAVIQIEYSACCLLQISTTKPLIQAKQLFTFSRIYRLFFGTTIRFFFFAKLPSRICQIVRPDDNHSQNWLLLWKIAAGAKLHRADCLLNPTS